MGKEKFFKKVLENGMTVIFEQRKGSGVVSVAFAVKHGGIHESEEEKGISHFIEHMLFKGTKNRTARQISAEIEKNGGSFNAYTDEEFTFYTSKMPSDKADVALDVLSDMIKNPLFDENELNKERQVIFQEMKLYQDNPRLHIQDILTSCLFKGSPGIGLIGTEKSMNSIGRNKILDKFNQVYRANNMLLCVVGDSDFKKLCDYCEKNFSKSSGKISEPVVERFNKEKIESRKDIGQANLIFAYHTADANKKENYAAQVLSCILGGGMSSRLWHEIRDKRNLAYVVHGSTSTGKRFGYSTISVGTSSENLKIVKKLIIEEFEKLKDMKKEELEQAKTQIIGNSRISKEDSSGQMADLMCNEIWDKAENSYEYEENIKKVELSDVKKIAERAAREHSFVALVPETKKEKK